MPVVKYLRIAAIAIVLNVCMSYTQKLFITSSETDAVIAGFLESASMFTITIFYFAMIAVIPFFEEVIFRGLLWKVVSRFWNDKAAVVLVAVAFSFLHSVDAAIFLLPFAVYLSYLRYTEGNIKPGIVAHICFNSSGLLLPRLF
tara:strand:- start:10 stop:441 length:432 start_codon:yes stop_codon:yes gene_type:complete